MNIFADNNYQRIIRNIVEDKKKVDRNSTFQKMAEKTRIPKSYLSKVITEKAHLSSDQLFLICQFLQLSDLQTSYLSLLLEYERSGVKYRKALLKKEILRIKDKALESEQHLKATSNQLAEGALRDYYLNPLHGVVHICLSIPRYQSNTKQLEKDLGVSTLELQEIISKLEEIGVIKKTGGGYETLIKSIHLPKTSMAYKPWRNQLRWLCVNRLNGSSQSSKDYSFSVTFSATQLACDQIRGEFLELLKKAESLVSESEKKEEAFQMNFDLFSWTK